MKYERTDWKNRVYDNEGNILQEGTPLVAKTMEKIEDGIIKNEADIAEIEKSKTRANGIATLNEAGELSESQIPASLREVDTHSHTNKSTLDKLVYNGEKASIDLIELEELKNHTHHASKIITNVDYQFVKQSKKNTWNGLVGNTKVVRNKTILTSSWVGSGSMFKSDILDENITENSIVDVNIHLADSELAKDLKSANESGEGKVTVYADKKPTGNILCDLKIVKVGSSYRDGYLETITWLHSGETEELYRDEKLSQTLAMDFTALKRIKLVSDGIFSVSFTFKITRFPGGLDRGEVQIFKNGEPIGRIYRTNANTFDIDGYSTIIGVKGDIFELRGRRTHVGQNYLQVSQFVVKGRAIYPPIPEAYRGVVAI